MRTIGSHVDQYDCRPLGRPRSQFQERPTFAVIYGRMRARLATPYWGE
jgi:hypothetical protein